MCNGWAISDPWQYSWSHQLLHTKIQFWNMVCNQWGMLNQNPLLSVLVLIVLTCRPKNVLRMLWKDAAFVTCHSCCLTYMYTYKAKSSNTISFLITSPSYLTAYGVCVLCVIVVSQKLIHLISDHLFKLSYWLCVVSVFFVLLLLTKSWFSEWAVGFAVGVFLGEQVCLLWLCLIPCSLLLCKL